MEPNVEPSSRPRLLSIDLFVARYGIGKTTVYRLIAAGKLRALKVGTRTVIPEDAAEQWLENLKPAHITTGMFTKASSKKEAANHAA